MNQIRDIFAPLKLAFLVFSEEKLAQDLFPKDTFVCSTGDALTDMYSLAECNYILGPASTFSMWASYYGGRPLFIMKANERIVDRAMAKMAVP